MPRWPSASRAHDDRLGCHRRRIRGDAAAHHRVASRQRAQPHAHRPSLPARHGVHERPVPRQGARLRPAFPGRAHVRPHLLRRLHHDRAKRMVAWSRLRARPRPVLQHGARRHPAAARASAHGHPLDRGSIRRAPGAAWLPHAQLRRSDPARRPCGPHGLRDAGRRFPLALRLSAHDAIASRYRPIANRARASLALTYRDTSVMDASPDNADEFGGHLQAAVTFATTEHFNLQTGRAATISEANGRATIYLAALSSSLIALAFIGQMSRVGSAFDAFALIVLPVLAFIGVVTFERLVQLSFEDIAYAERIGPTRDFYWG